MAVAETPESLQRAKPSACNALVHQSESLVCLLSRDVSDKSVFKKSSHRSAWNLDDNLHSQLVVTEAQILVGVQVVTGSTTVECDPWLVGEPPIVDEGLSAGVHEGEAFVSIPVPDI